QASPIQATHSYTVPGMNTVRVTVTDKDGAPGSGTLTVTAAEQVVTLVGAGNIARCDRTNDEATAAILDSIVKTIPGSLVFALGDNAAPGGTATSYASCYDPTWGRQKSRTYPLPGNHDYDSSATADGYFGYFGAPGKAADPVNGIREFIVGTGGEGLDSPVTLVIANSEAHISGVYGVLKLTLGDGSYSWQFIPVAGQTTDSGTDACH